MNTGVQITLQDVINSGDIPEVELLDRQLPYCNSIFSFEEPPYCSPYQLHHFTFQPAMHKGFNLSTSLPTLTFSVF